MGLAELYRTTGNPEYLALLKKAVMLRDSVKEGMDDNQDRLMLKAHDKIIGHAVRIIVCMQVADVNLEEETGVSRRCAVGWRLGGTEAVYNRRMRRAL